MPRAFTLLRLAIFASCLVPCAWLAWDTVHGSLGPDPVQQITHRTGDWALRFLLIMALSPG